MEQILITSDAGVTTIHLDIILLCLLGLMALWGSGAFLGFIGSTVDLDFLKPSFFDRCERALMIGWWIGVPYFALGCFLVSPIFKCSGLAIKIFIVILAMASFLIGWSMQAYRRWR